MKAVESLKLDNPTYYRQVIEVLRSAVLEHVDHTAEEQAMTDTTDTAEVERQFKHTLSQATKVGEPVIDEVMVDFFYVEKELKRRIGEAIKADRRPFTEIFPLMAAKGVDPQHAADLCERGEKSNVSPLLALVIAYKLGYSLTVTPPKVEVTRGAPSTDLTSSGKRRASLSSAGPGPLKQAHDLATTTTLSDKEDKAYDGHD